MTKEECIKILAILGAFYGGGKTDPKEQASAWYVILQKYPYDIAEKAVFDFAENDVRDYATFPAVGKVVQAIRKKQLKDSRAINEVITGVSYGRSYSGLSEDSKRLISEKLYNNWLAINAQFFAENVHKFREVLENNQLKLGGDVSE